MTGDINRTTPIGLYNFGVAYLDTARAAVSSEATINFHGPFEFLCAHGLELIFKADITRNIPLETVRVQYSHNLIKLFCGCSAELKQRFAITDAFREVLNFLAEGHSHQPFENRYLRTGYRQIIEPKVVLEHLAQLTTSDRQWVFAHFGGAI